MDTDRALSELKKLREGRGLNPDRLADSPAVLSALATSDPGEAYQALCLLLNRMGDGDRIRALKVDFGLELPELLQRAPTSRERDWLGERRAGLATVIGRDVKTLARWSDRTLGELRSQLLTDQFDGQLVITAGVKNKRVAGVEVMRYEKEDEHLSSGQNIGYTNPEAGPSLPLVLYGFPRDWRPKSIRFVMAFMDEELPTHVWALVADSVLDVGFGHERTELDITDGIARCRIENPRRDQLYGVWWEW
ncbi:MAG: hypothetical protein QOF60_3103 [Actinomycetota bacterium]|jgi:hypothetical protein|nr:hypothetical protein [Actinomycetota bacterium]